MWSLNTNTLESCISYINNILNPVHTIDGLPVLCNLWSMNTHTHRIEGLSIVCNLCSVNTHTLIGFAHRPGDVGRAKIRRMSTRQCSN